MKKKGFTLVELLVVIAIIALLMGILMPALARVRQIAFRMVCGTNLSGIGKAMLIYANDYQDELPKSGGPNAKWIDILPVASNHGWNAGTRDLAYSIDNGAGGYGTITSCFYLLVKYAEVTPKSFICKGDTNVTEYEVPNNTTDLIALWDFGEKPINHCSYSYHNPFNNNTSGTNMTPFPLTTTSDPGMAVAADPNPWCGSGDRADADFTAFKTTGGKEFTKLGNTINHQDEGQQVLFLDSHVEFETVSFCGLNQDNIYTTQTDMGTGGLEIMKGNKPTNGGYAPLNRTDSILTVDYGTSSSKRPGKCFLGDTIVCVDGKLTPISQVTAGQKLANNAIVESLEENTGTYTCRDIVLTNGNKISVVEKHYFMLDSGIWVRSYDLRSGMTLRTQNGSAVIKSVTVREQPYVGKVYNIFVAKGEQYMVGTDGVVVRDW